MISMQEISLNREQIRELKKKKGPELVRFLKNIYLEGYKEGLHTTPKVTPEAINKIIKNTKGVGESKRRAIMEQVTKLFEMED